VTETFVTPFLESPFSSVAAILLMAALLGGLALWLRQPLIVAFVAVGVLVGPAGFGWVVASDEIELLAKIGIAILLFVVGLKLDLRLIRLMGPRVVITGLVQLILTFGLGYWIASALGFAGASALYVALTVAFSSTIIVVKLLSDMREIDGLHGRIALGILIVQDIVILLALAGLTASGAAETGLGLVESIAAVLLKGVAFFALIALFARYGLSILLRWIAASEELLVLFSIAWAVALGAGGELLGFSKEVGAFVAGVSLASTPYREAIGSRLVSLRDFLLLFFFIDLGSRIDLSLLGDQIGPAILLSVFVLVFKPLVVMTTMGLQRYRKRTSFLSGLALAQISEFSLILAALGVSLGHIGTDVLGLITLVALITIAVSTYIVQYSHPLYDRIRHRLGIFERQVPHPEESADRVAELHSLDVIIFGLGRYGGEIARGLSDRGWQVLGVDFDPQVVRALSKEGMRVRYGNADDPEFLAFLPLERAGWVVSTAPERDVNLTLLNGLRMHGYEGRIAIRAHDADDAEMLNEAGAHVVLSVFSDAAKEAVDLLATARELDK